MDYYRAFISVQHLLLHIFISIDVKHVHLAEYMNISTDECEHEGLVWKLWCVLLQLRVGMDMSNSALIR